MFFVGILRDEIKEKSMYKCIFVYLLYIGDVVFCYICMDVYFLM